MKHFLPGICLLMFSIFLLTACTKDNNEPPGNQESPVQILAANQETEPGLPVSFNAELDQGSGNATAYQWSFPGGEPSESTGANPVVVYNHSGYYDVTLQVVTSSGTYTRQRSNFIRVGSGISGDWAALPLAEAAGGIELLDCSGGKLTVVAGVETFQSLTNGSTWKKLPLGIKPLVFVSDDRTMLALGLSDTAIPNAWFSVNGGLSWTSCEFRDHASPPESLAATILNGTLFVSFTWQSGEFAEAYYSSDQGTTWQSYTMFTNQSAAILNFHKTGDIVFATVKSGGVYRTADGFSWVPAHGIPSLGSVSADGDALFAVTAADACCGQGLYRSDDKGINWTQVSSRQLSGITGYNGVLFAWESEAGTVNPVFSANAGRTWSGFRDNLDRLLTSGLQFTRMQTAGSRLVFGTSAEGGTEGVGLLQRSLTEFAPQ